MLKLNNVKIFITFNRINWITFEFFITLNSHLIITFNIHITLNSHSIITFNIHITVNGIIIFDLSPGLQFTMVGPRVLLYNPNNCFNNVGMAAQFSGTSKVEGSLYKVETRNSPSSDVIPYNQDEHLHARPL